MNKVEGNTLPCGYVNGCPWSIGFGIPGLKSRDLRAPFAFFPLALVDGKFTYGLSPPLCKYGCSLFLELLASELRTCLWMTTLWSFEEKHPK